MNRPIEHKIICTLGPASLNADTIHRLERGGISLFRINLSHTPLEKIESSIRTIRETSKVPICLDSEGAQIRNGLMESSQVRYPEGAIIEISRAPVVGNEKKISFTPDFIADQLRIGDLISIDFNSLLLKVCEASAEKITAVVLCGGVAGSNKAVNLNRPVSLPPISAKDEEAIRIGLKNNVEWFALSFASSKSDVENVRRLSHNKMKIISKIENRAALLNLEKIAEVSDALLIDRGDLSREEPLERIPFLQKEIIRTGNACKIPVFVATNLLESMVFQKKPTRAEVNDIVNTLLDGAQGLVLAAETAIGKYPVDCVQMVSKVIQAFENLGPAYTLNSLIKNSSTSLSLPAPVGGSLIQRVSSIDASLNSLNSIEVSYETLIDCEQIATGVYSPLSGFMTELQLDSVLKTYRLPEGTIWTLPITLQVKAAVGESIKMGDRALLRSSSDKQAYAYLDVEDIYAPNLESLTKAWFDTTEMAHPGVARVKNAGEIFLGGKITLVQYLPSRLRSMILTPEETRRIFEHRGWNVVVGFHTRNIAHRAHEHLHRSILSRLDVDGLFVHPVIGPKKSNDYTGEIIVKAYQALIERHYPTDKVLLGAFHTFSRYAGPREAVFTALCRKNYGCSHFIVGRDHTGVGNYYAPDASQKLFETLGDIGISPIYFNKVYFCKICKDTRETCAHENSKDHIIDLSATSARDFFRRGEIPPEHLMRQDVAQLIADEYSAGGEVFVA